MPLLLPPSRPPRRKHARSRSDFAWAPNSHPLSGNASGGNGNVNVNVNGNVKQGGGRSGSPSPKPPRARATNPLSKSLILKLDDSGSVGGASRTSSRQGGRRGHRATLSGGSFGGGNSHRRAKSEVPFMGTGALNRITKQDLLKNLPNPRWGTSLPCNGQNNYSPKALPPAIIIGDAAKKPGGKHLRSKSDMSLHPVESETAAKSALVRGVTAEGMIQYQLPKDSFRLLVDNQLQEGAVYRRKLIDDEDDMYLEFHTVEDTFGDNQHDRHCAVDVEDPFGNLLVHNGGGNGAPCDGRACKCQCERCKRCLDKQKRLPPDLYVMSVDSSIYRRMLDEIIESRAMPCGLFFCGHHEDVRYPDIRIAIVAVMMLFSFLFWVAFVVKG